MRTTLSRGALLGLGTALLLGISSCGGGSSGGAGSVTSVSATRMLNGLSASETTQLCVDSHAYAGRALSMPNTCNFSAVLLTAFAGPATDAEARMTCTSVYNQCLASPSTADPQPPTCDAIPENCTATVAQYSACLSDGVASVNEELGALPKCSALTLASLSTASSGAPSGTPPTTVACMAFAAACPGYMPPVPTN